MRAIRLIAVAALAAIPTVAAAQSVETNAPRGSLAVAAIERGDMAAAERLLASSELSAGDPARLINTGYVLWTQGRRAQAVAAWNAAAEAPRPIALETLDGREVRSDVLARQILARVSATAAR